MNSPKTGIYTASLTPLTSLYQPNLPALVNHVEHLFESGSVPAAKGFRTCDSCSRFLYWDSE